MHLDEVSVNILPDGRLDTRNAALYLGLSPKTLAMMRCQGDGPQFIKRGRVFYYKCDLDEWIGQAARATSTARANVIISTDGHALNSRGRIESRPQTNFSHVICKMIAAVFPCRGKSVLPNKAYHALALSVNPKPTLFPALAPRSPLTLRPLIRLLQHNTNLIALMAQGE